MINENEIHQDYKLEREHYFLDQHLTNTVFLLPQFAGEIINSKLLNRVRNYVYLNKLLNDNQKIAIGYRDIDGERCRRYGLYVFTDPTEKVLERKPNIIVTDIIQTIVEATNSFNQNVNCRGFMEVSFQDVYGNECSIQESSSATEPRLWLGLKDAKAKYKGVVDYPLPEEVKIFTRMHINQEQAKMLIPLLQKFVEHGKLESL